MLPKSVLREEEEWGGGTGGAYAPPDTGSVAQWWNDLELAAPKFAMYAVFLATREDAELVSFIETHRSALKNVAGDNCCFVYFRDEEAASTLRPWSYSEHEKFVYPVAKLIGVTPKQLPCIVFFRKFTAGKYWREELRGVASDELINKLRDIFSDIQWDATDPFKRYHRIVFWEKATTMIQGAAEELAKQSPKLAIDLWRILTGR